MTMELSVGDRAPAFKLPADGGGEVSLADFHGHKLVLYFYPKADTEGCTREALGFTALRERFARADTAILGVSADPVTALDRFKAKHDLRIQLATDTTHKVLEAYGVWGEKSMYGRTFLGVFRTTYLIDKAGRIARIWQKVKVAGHAEDVLAAAENL
jgi:peroxiredoxin Q/BCP